MAAVINLFELARCGQSAGGELALSDMPRVESIKREGALRWKAAGFVNRQNKLYLDLEIAGLIDLVCQRCLEPVDLELAVQRRFLIARTEREADAVPLDDDSLEVVVGSESFDIQALVEDEVLLSLPIVAMHSACSQPWLSSDRDDGQSAKDLRSGMKLSPFADLEKLKSR